MRERWQFIQSPAGDWYWLCSDVISHKTRTSAATFKTRTECIADAMGNGYQKLGAQGAPAGAARTAASSQGSLVKLVIVSYADPGPGLPSVGIQEPQGVD